MTQIISEDFNNNPIIAEAFHIANAQDIVAGSNAVHGGETQVGSTKKIIGGELSSRRYLYIKVSGDATNMVRIGSQTITSTSGLLINGTYLPMQFGIKPDIDVYVISANASNQNVSWLEIG